MNVSNPSNSKMLVDFVISLLCVKLTLQSMCTELSNFPHLNTSYTVDGTPIQENLTVGLLSCVEICKRTRDCDAFTYNLDTSKCSLYREYRTSLTNTSSHVVSSRLKDWFKNVEAPEKRTPTQGSKILEGNSTVHEDVGCYTMVEGHGHYTGKVNVTKNGNPCQRWDSQVPQEHDYGTESDHFHNVSNMSEVSNYCRSPRNFEDDTLWCYTIVPGIRWEHCGIPSC